MNSINNTDIKFNSQFSVNSDYNIAKEILKESPVWLKIFKKFWKILLKQDNFEDIRDELLNNSTILATHILFLESIFKNHGMTSKEWNNETNLICDSLFKLDIWYLWDELISIINNEFLNEYASIYKSSTEALNAFNKKAISILD